MFVVGYTTLSSDHPPQRDVQDYDREMRRTYVCKKCGNAPKEAAPNLKGIVDMSCKPPPAKNHARCNNSIKLESLAQNFIHLSKHVYQSLGAKDWQQTARLRCHLIYVISLTMMKQLFSKNKKKENRKKRKT